MNTARPPGTARAAERLRAALAATAATVDEAALRPLAVPRRPPRRWAAILAPAAAAAAAAVIVLAEFAAGPITHSSPRTAPRLSTGTVIHVAGRPSSAVLDPGTGTLYLGSGRTGLTVVDAAACSAASRRGCGHSGHVRLPGGQEASALVLDRATRTLFVLSRVTSSVAVLSTGTCNAASTRGCRSAGAVIRLPAVPDAMAISQHTGTVYVTYPGSAALSMIDARACTAARPGACAAALTTAPMSAVAGAGSPVAVDPASGTLYIGTASGVFLIDGRTCNAADSSGCTTVLATAPVAGSPTGIAVDPTAGQVYVSSAGTSQITVIGWAACRAGQVTGCASRPRVIRGGALPEEALAVPQVHTVYVADAETNSVSMISQTGCSAGPGSCGQVPVSFPAGTGPVALAADVPARTVYVVGNGGSVSVIDSATCNAADQHGCPTRSPAGTTAPEAGRNPVYYCDPVITGYQSGLPAAPLLQGSARVAAGTSGGLRWSLWAKKGIPSPYGIEQGGVVVNGRWYALCGAPLSAGPGANIQVIDTGSRGIVYGYIQHPRPVDISVAAGHLLRPSSVLLDGTTFFIGRLPRAACSYPAMTLYAHATAGPAWGGWTSLVLSGCVPGWLRSTTITGGIWGPGAHTGPAPGAGS